MLVTIGGLLARLPRGAVSLGVFFPELHARGPGAVDGAQFAFEISFRGKETASSIITILQIGII